MSLVEQALKKAKQAGPPLPLSTQPPAARPADLHDDIAAVPPRPAAAEEVIEPSPEITATVQAFKFLTLDRDALRAAGYLPPVDQEREISEQYRHLKRPLVARALGRGHDRLPNGMRIAVSSALQGEGKTFTSVNLAMSIALEKDVRVVLVDADVARAELSRVFGVKSQPGLIDTLSDSSVDVASLVYETNIEGLQVLPAGRSDTTAAEWLASPRMEEVMRRLVGKDDNCILILDSPPLLVTNEAKAVCEAAGQVVLVVRANLTPQNAVAEALAHVTGSRYVGLVLNASDVVPGGGYGYYGGNYGYGQYGRSD
jgi:exopolysaccharide/PEP-CTERM locus tyrosine autokinase